MGSEVRTHVLNTRIFSPSPSEGFNLGVTYPQCMARAFLALTSLNIRTASAGDACKFDHIARG